MQIVIVTATFSAENINQALKILQDLETQTKRDEACEIYQICLDAKQRTRVQIYQLWQSQSAFEAYKTSDAFAEMGKGLAPLMTSAPQTAIFDATRTT